MSEEKIYRASLFTRVALSFLPVGCLLFFLLALWMGSDGSSEIAAIGKLLSVLVFIMMLGSIFLAVRVHKAWLQFSGKGIFCKDCLKTREIRWTDIDEVVVHKDFQGHATVSVSYLDNGTERVWRTQPRFWQNGAKIAERLMNAEKEKAKSVTRPTF